MVKGRVKQHRINMKVHIKPALGTIQELKKIKRRYGGMELGDIKMWARNSEGAWKWAPGWGDVAYWANPGTMRAMMWAANADPKGTHGVRRP